MNKFLNFVDKWSTLGFNAMFIGAGVLICKHGIDMFYSNYEDFATRK